MNVGARLVGLDTVRSQLAQLDQETRDIVLPDAVLQALRPLESAARANAPTNDIRNAIAALGVFRSGTEGAVGVVGVPTRAKGTAFTWRWFEFGTKLRFRKSTREAWQDRAEGKRATGKQRKLIRRTDKKLPTGRMSARPFLRPALDSAFPQMVRIFGEAIARGVAMFTVAKHG